MTISVSLGHIPRTGVLLTADCVRCGTDFRAVLPDEHTAARAGVDHRCGTGVVGPLWTLIQPPALKGAAGPAERGERGMSEFLLRLLATVVLACLIAWGVDLSGHWIAWWAATPIAAVIVFGGWLILSDDGDWFR